MLNFWVILLLFIQVLLIILAILFLRKKPFDLGTLLIILHITFYAFPAWDYYFGWNIFENVIQGVHVYRSSVDALYLNYITTIIMLFFYLGYIMVAVTIKNKKKDISSIKLRINRLKVLKFVILILWFGIFMYTFYNYNNNLLLFFTPSRKDGVFTSSYHSILYTFLPTVYFVLSILKDYFTEKKIKLKTFLLFLFPLLAYFTTGQRREIIVFMIFTILLFIHLKSRNDETNVLKELIYKRKKLIQLGALAIILIPTLWWGRVIFSQLQRGTLDLIAPWQRRGFLELLFGSSSGGFRTLILGLDHAEIFNIPKGYSVFFLLTSFIPRSIYYNKPVIINIRWKQDLNLEGNPSTFFVNEIYLNFDLWGVIFAFIFGIILAYFFYRWYNSNYIVYNVLSFVLFSNIITLFKNGFSQYIINTLIPIVGFAIILSLVFKIKRNNGKRTNWIKKLKT